MTGKTSVSSEAIVSHDRIKDAVYRAIRHEIFVTHRFTAGQLATESGVPLSCIQSYMKGDISERKEPSLSYALSIAVVLGPRAVSTILAVIGYVGTPLEDADEIHPMQIVSRCLTNFAVVGEAAADGRFDHSESPRVQVATDAIIEILTPLSSKGRAA